MKTELQSQTAVCSSTFHIFALFFANNLIMYSLIIFIGGVVSVALASPQWYNSGSHSGFGGGFAGSFGGHHAGGAAPLGPDGRVIDTPEVQNLKSSHLATLAEAAARAPKAPSNYDVHEGGFNGIFDSGNHDTYGHSGSYDGPRYYGPPAPLGADGRVVDTPEVEAAKAHHFALYKAAAQKVPASSPSDFPNAHSNYDSGEYNPAWDSPTYKNHY